jgi:hypothetical protein
MVPQKVSRTEMKRQTLKVVHVRIMEKLQNRIANWWNYLYKYFPYKVYERQFNQQLQCNPDILIQGSVRI